MTIEFNDLANLLKPSRLIQDKARQGWSRDCWPQALGWTSEESAAHAPAAVAVPENEETAAGVLAWCHARGISVVPRGAGSSVVGGAIPSKSGCLVLDTSLLDRRFELNGDMEKPTVDVGAGWLGSELEERLNTMGWSLKHFPASMAISTVGGWIAHDSYGQLSTRYGGIREQTSSVRSLLPDGSTRVESPALHFGAEGTLGILTTATLDIRPNPHRRRFAAYSLPDAKSAVGFARDIMAQEVKPSVLRLYGPVDTILTGLKKKGDGGSALGAALKPRIEAFLMRHNSWVQALRPLVGKQWCAVLVYEEENGEMAGPPPAPPEAIALGPGPAERWWGRRYHWSRDRLQEVFANGCFADTVDLWAPWDKLAELEREVREAISPSAFAFSHYSHFDDTGACLYVTFAGYGNSALHARAWSDAMDACISVGGSVNHHHGFGLAKLPWLEKGRPGSGLEGILIARKKRDPNQLLNPGKLCR